MPRRRPSRRFGRRRFGRSRTKRSFKRRRITRKRRPSISVHSYKFVENSSYTQSPHLMTSAGLYVNIGANSVSLSDFTAATTLSGVYSYYRIKKVIVKITPLQKQSTMVTSSGGSIDAFVPPRILTVIDRDYPSLCASNTNPDLFEQYPSMRETVQGRTVVRSWTPAISAPMLETGTSVTAYGPKKCPWIRTSFTDVNLWGIYILLCWDQSAAGASTYQEWAAGNFEITTTAYIDFKQLTAILS
jgi:hypothetical protein